MVEIVYHPVCATLIAPFKTKANLIFVLIRKIKIKNKIKKEKEKKKPS